MVNIVADKMPPTPVLILSLPYMLKAGIVYPNLSILRKKLFICHGDSLKRRKLLPFLFFLFAYFYIFIISK